MKMKVVLFCVLLAACTRALSRNEQIIKTVMEKYIGLGYNLARGTFLNPWPGHTTPRSLEDPGNSLPVYRLSTAPRVKLYRKASFQAVTDFNVARYASASTQQCSSSEVVMTSPESYQADLLRRLLNRDDLPDYVTEKAFQVGPDTLKEKIVIDKVTQCDFSSMIPDELAPPSPEAPEFREKIRPSHFFERNVCQLPSKVYDHEAYFSLLRQYGTHVITDLAPGLLHMYRLGYDKVTLVRELVTRFPALTRVVNVTDAFRSLDEGTEQEIRVTRKDMLKTLEQWKDDIYKEKASLNAGSSSFPIPLKMKFSPVSDFITEEFFGESLCPVSSGSGDIESETVETTHEGCCARLPGIKAFLERAIAEYYGLLDKPRVEDGLSARFTWPKGTYGLLSPATGCPANSADWETGFRFQHTHEASKITNPWPFSEKTLTYKKEQNYYGLALDFCIKTGNERDEMKFSWPKGKYCIFRKGACPNGMRSGFVFFEDYFSPFYQNINENKGQLPDGEYTEDTLYKFCCRDDGDHYKQLVLPTRRPFFLVRRGGACHKVRDMKLSIHAVTWDVDDQCKFPSLSVGCYTKEEQESQKGMYPDVKWPGDRENIRMFFCYYKPE